MANYGGQTGLARTPACLRDLRMGAQASGRCALALLPPRPGARVHVPGSCPRRRALPSARLRLLLVRAAANAVFLVTSLSVLAVARPVIMARRARRRWGQ